MYLATFTFTVAVLPVLLLCYYLIPAKGKNGFLLACSLIIYGWGAPLRVLYPLAAICFDFGMGLLLERFQKKRMLCTCLLGGAAVIHTGSLMAIRTYSAAGAIMFPFGMAVMTLHGLGYLIGIYQKRHGATLNFLHVALYLCYFPVLYAGPVMAYPTFEEQLRSRKCNIFHLGDGLALFIQGLAEKVVLADTFGYIFRELRQTGEMSMLTAWLTTVSFTMYLYFELLGYSEMARGLGRAMGFDIPKNFSHPFFTPNVTMFMQSWSMTVLTWFQENFRSFLFPQQNKKRQKYAVIILTWLFIGAWYGMRPQFILWGLVIGVLVTLDQMLFQPLTRNHYVPGMIYTALLTQFSWVLFFADDLSEVGMIWKSMLGFGKGIADSYGFYFFTSYIALILLGLYIATDLFRNITDRVSTTRFGEFITSLRPLGLGIVFVFSLASMLYGERIEGLWLNL